MGSPRSRVHRGKARNPRNANGQVVRSNRHRISRQAQSRICGREVRHRESLLILRRTNFRQGYRCHLQCASEQPSRSLVDQVSRCRLTRTSRKADQHHGGRCEKTTGGSQSHWREDRRSFHGTDPSTMAADPRTGFVPDALGRLRSISGQFSYFNRDPANIRNIRTSGGRRLCSGHGLLPDHSVPIHFRRGSPPAFSGPLTATRIAIPIPIV